jgi:uncharacterized protein (DUF697 family)
MNGASQTILKIVATIIGVIIAASLAYPLGFIIAQSILGSGNIILSDINN